MPQIRLKTYPHRGLVTNYSPDSAYLKQPVGDGSLITASPDMMNVTVHERLGTCRKADGYRAYTSAVNATHTRCLGLYELKYGAYRDQIVCDGGKIYLIDATLEQDDITGAGVTLAADLGDIYAFTRYGADVVLCDNGEHVPYHWKHGDAAIAACNTAYKLKYPCYLFKRVVAAYSDQTNGRIGLHWADALAAIATNPLCPAANILYSEGEGDVTGLKRWGNYGVLGHEDSLVAVDFYPGSPNEQVLGTTVAVCDSGPVNHHSMVEAFGELHFLTLDRGFCKYAGGNQVQETSADIRNVVNTIHRTYAARTVGVFDEVNKRIVWTVPLYGSATPSHLLIYYPQTGQWEILDYVAYYMDYWQVSSSWAWTAFGDTLVEEQADEWATYVAAGTAVVFGATDGHVYQLGGGSKAGAALESYRDEPIMDFGDPQRMKHLKEVWFYPSLKGDFNLNCQFRSGETAAACAAAAWSNVHSVNMNAAPIRFTPNQNARSHQIKWGTTGADEKFGIDSIEYVAETGGTR